MFETQGNLVYISKTNKPSRPFIPIFVMNFIIVTILYSTDIKLGIPNSLSNNTSIHCGGPRHIFHLAARKLIASDVFFVDIAYPSATIDSSMSINVFYEDSFWLLHIN